MPWTESTKMDEKLKFVSRLIFGLIQHWIAIFFSVFVATFAISMLLAALLLIKSALSDWLDILEDHNNNNKNLKVMQKGNRCHLFHSL